MNENDVISEFKINSVTYYRLIFLKLKIKYFFSNWNFRLRAAKRTFEGHRWPAGHQFDTPAVNHNLHFADPETKVQTNTIEG
jgi:hypothetical protein